jgi:phosphoribosylformylglycinamidine cyclo-ligase
MNCNDLLCVGATPALFLDYIAVGSKELMREHGILGDFIKGLVHHCAATGQLLVGGETAQMPDLYGAHGFDLAGFSVGFMHPRDHLSISRAQPGSQLWGWSSSGPHSNGFSLLRSLFDSERDAAFIRESLMAGTRLYVNELKELRAKLKADGAEDALQAAFHITGSGLLNLIRSQPEGRTVGFDLDGVREAAWPAWAREVARRSGGAKRDLYTTFNMGLGFGLVLSAHHSERLKDLLSSLGLTRWGKVSNEPVVRVEGFTLE